MSDTSPNRITVFSKENCSYCVKAKEFFSDHNLPFTEIKLDAASESYAAQRDALVLRTNQRTFPFVFVGETFVGGYTDVMTACETLKLHDLLKTIGMHLEPEF